MQTIRPCPICTSVDYSRLFELNYTFPSENYNMEKCHTVCACNNCGFVFNSDGKNYVNLDAYYINNNRYEGLTYAYFGSAFDYITANIDKNATILDIGSGSGHLLLALKTAGYENLYGLDPSAHCCEIMNSKGIKAINGSIYDSMDKFCNFFDVVILTNVIEHLCHPEAAIENISNWLSLSGGEVYIEAPDGEKYADNYRNLSGLYCAEHINHFSKKHMDYLLGKYGMYRICKIDDSLAIRLIYKKGAAEVVEHFSKSDCLKKSCQNAYAIMQVHKTITRNTLKKHKGKNIAIWGFTHQFMAMYPQCFSDCSIRVIIDMDPGKHGIIIDSIEIVSPAALNSFDGSIVVLNNSSKADILRSIETFGFSQEIITFPESQVIENGFI